LAHGNAAFAAAERGDNPRTVEIQTDLLQGCPANVIVTSDPYQATYILVFRRQNGKRSTMFVFGGLSGLALSAAMKVDGASLFKTNGDMVYSTKQRTVEKTIKDVCSNLPSEVTLSAGKARLGADAVSNSVVPAVSASAIIARSEKPQAQAQVNGPLVDVAQVPQTNASSIVTISSSPIGAEISVGTDFVGNTPSSINVSPGRHLITITKSGYKDWQRIVTVLGGTVTLNADLTPGPAVETAPSTSVGITPQYPVPSVSKSESEEKTIAAARDQKNSDLSRATPGLAATADGMRAPETQPPASPVPTGSSIVATRSLKTLAVLNNTPIMAKLITNMDASRVQVGDIVDAKALENVKQGHDVLIKTGAILNGHVTLVQRFRRPDIPCMVAILFDRVTVQDGEQVALNVGIQALGTSVDANSESLRSGRGMEQNALDAETSSLTRPDDNNGARAIRLDANTADRLNHNSIGVYGIAHVTLGYEMSEAGSISVVQSSAGNIHLTRGMQLVLKVNAALQETTTAVSPASRVETQSSIEMKAVPGWIGVTTKDDEARGVVITRVLAESAAALAGLQIGDIIDGLNGTPVRSGMEFDIAIAHSKPGSHIRISYIRGAWKSEATLTVGAIA
jgi:hypothetical protein